MMHEKRLVKKNWQPDYHDHVIRDDQSYLRIKIYIRNNPENWDDDKFNDPENSVANCTTCSLVDLQIKYRLNINGFITQ
jgi:hypothetical protein